MTQIDRRALIGAAGIASAGLALSACGGNKPSESQSKDVNALAPPGLDDAWGQEVAEEGPVITGNVMKFDPEFICLVYLRLNQASGLKVKIRYFDYNGAPTAASLIDWFREIRHDKPNANAKSEKDNFDEFSLGAQQLVVIFVDNKDDVLKFSDKKPGAGIKKSFVIRFSKYGGVNPNRIVNQNHAFFNINTINLPLDNPTTSESLEGSLAYTLEYWNADARGNTIAGTVYRMPSTYYMFSMNIHLLLAITNPNGGASQSWVPIIVDPDTGNMGSRP